VLARDNVRLELIGHDIQGPNAGNTFEDYYVCKQLARAFPRCMVAPFFYSPIEAKSYISGLDLLIGSRMHACIAAYSSGVPVFPLAYSRKFSGLFADRLGYRHGVDLTVAGREDVQTELGACLDGLPGIRAQFGHRLKAIEAHKRALVSSLSRTMAKLL
jgi:polysaccharide pyruvyl transferase WcaK-like protein